MIFSDILSILKFILNLIIIVSFVHCSAKKYACVEQAAFIDISEFYDSAHHWYDINDDMKIISPARGQKRYDKTQIEEIANNILLYQKSNGGWPKNYDMLAILTNEQKQAILESKNELNTTFDNGATYSQLNYLAKAYSLTKLEKYKQAFLAGLQFILAAQYDNGGWPQFYPDLSGYKKFITFNDGAMIGVMNLLKNIVDKKKEYTFIDEELYLQVKNAYENGIDCILKCQIKENGKLLAWCQQHDNVDFHPQNARSFEVASITNGESASIVKFLMSIENPDYRIINSIIGAVEWFEKSKIYGKKIEEIKSSRVDYIYHTTDVDKILVDDSSAKPIWARFYELKSHKPLFCNRDGKIVYSFEEVERERRTGYAWFVYDPQEVLDLYPVWFEKWSKH